MNIIELRDRLTRIIEDNERQGWGERNNSRVAVKHQASKRIYEYRPVKYACGSWLGLNDESVFEIITEDEPIWRKK